MLEIKGLEKSYINRNILRGLSLEVEKNKIYGLVGPNGTGKSTFFKILIGLTPKTSGEIYFKGQSLDRQGREQIAFMPPEDYFFNWMKVKDAINFYADFYLDFDKNKAIDLIKRMELYLDQKISSLSTGQKGRLKIVLVLCRNVSLYLIDEPLNGLDPISRDIVIDIFQEEKKADKAFIISTHLIDDLDKIMDNLVMFRDGKVHINKECKLISEETNMTLNEYYKTIY